MLRRWDEVTLALSNVGAIAGLYSNGHPDLEVRTASEEAEIEVDKLVTELRQDRALYDVFAALDPAGLDPTGPRLLEKTLEEFRRAGVDQDDATRARLAEISERITAIDQEFSRNIRDDVRTVRSTPEQLAGLPEDWLDAHPVDDDGLVPVTTDYPDAIPARMFVRDADVRRQITIAFLERGWPANEPLLKELFDLRHEYANLVGYSDWASYDAAVKMIEKGPAIPEFIDRIAQAAQGPMERDLAVVMERFRQDVPDADSIDVGRLRLLRGAGAQGAARRRLAAGAHLLRLREGASRGCSTSPVGCSACATSRSPDAVAVARGRHGVRRAPRRGTETDGESLGRIYLDLHPARGQVQARRAVHDHQRRRRPAAARGRAGVQLRQGADGARPRGDAVPRVRPPGAPRARRPRRLDPLRRRRDRVGLRRGAQPDARGVGVGRRRAADLRDQRRRRADPGRPRRPDARGRRLRQGAPGPAADVLRRGVLLVPHRAAGRPDRQARSSCRSATRRSATSTAPTSSPTSATSAATRRPTTPTCGRW